MENKTIEEPAQNNPLTEQDWCDWTRYVAETFGIELNGEALLAFKTFLAELKDWNEKINLVSFKSDKEVLYRHFADSLAGARLIKKLCGPQAPRIIDIGAGAGFPGIPVYIASPYRDITLLESITKKTAFISHIKEKLALAGVKIINNRAENAARDRAHRAAYDFVLSRAVARLSPNIEIALPLLKTGGYALIYKTGKSSSDAELSAGSRALKLLGGEISDKFCYTIPYEEQPYCVVAFKKISGTPELYPRRAGTPEKKPL